MSDIYVRSCMGSWVQETKSLHFKRSKVKVGGEVCTLLNTLLVSLRVYLISFLSSVFTFFFSYAFFISCLLPILYVTPKSPKGWHKNAISLFVAVKFNFSRKKSLLQSFVV